MKNPNEIDAALETDTHLADREWYAAHPEIGDAIQAEGERMERWKTDGSGEKLLASGVYVWFKGECKKAALECEKLPDWARREAGLTVPGDGRLN